MELKFKRNIFDQGSEVGKYARRNVNDNCFELHVLQIALNRRFKGCSFLSKDKDLLIQIVQNQNIVIFESIIGYVVLFEYLLRNTCVWVYPVTS